MVSQGGGTPVWVWVVYALGLLAAVVLVGSGLFTLGALLSDDTGVGYDVSVLGFVLWGGLLLLAVGTWAWRRGGSGR
jgi:hypothetical protein